MRAGSEKQHALFDLVCRCTRSCNLVAVWSSGGNARRERNHRFRAPPGFTKMDTSCRDRRRTYRASGGPVHYINQVTTKPMLAANTTIVVPHPRILIVRLLILSPMI